MIFFDLDGPILDVKERYYLIYKNILKEHNKNFLGKEEYWQLKRNKIPISEILKKTMSKDIIGKYAKERIKIIETPEYLKYDRVIKGASQILQKLQTKNHLVLVTLRKKRKELVQQLEEFNLLNYFEIILNSGKDLEPRWKIKYNLIIQNYKNLSRNFVIVGDTETDILAGKNLGIKTIAVLNGIRTKKILEKEHPDFLIKDITRLELCLKKPSKY